MRRKMKENKKTKVRGKIVREERTTRVESEKMAENGES